MRDVSCLQITCKDAVPVDSRGTLNRDWAILQANIAGGIERALWHALAY